MILEIIAGRSLKLQAGEGLPIVSEAPSAGDLLEKEQSLLSFCFSGPVFSNVLMKVILPLVDQKKCLDFFKWKQGNDSTLIESQVL